MKNRNGAYKKILIGQDELQKNKETLCLVLEEICWEFENNRLSPQDFTTIYILLYQRIRSPKNWLQKIKMSPKVGVSLLDILPSSMNLSDWEKEKLEGVCGEVLFSDFTLKGIPASVNRAMVNWYKGQWKIQMLQYIPTSRELLKLQAANTRCITVMTKNESFAQLVLSSRDPLSFVLHDLMHADQFFSQEMSLKGQLGFYKLIDLIYDKDETKKLLKSDANFKKEFEYVVSDMNAYVIHLFKCLKSSIGRTPESEFYFQYLLNSWQMSALESEASKKLNTPEFELKDELILKEFFEKNQEIVL